MHLISARARCSPPTPSGWASPSTSPYSTTRSSTAPTRLVSSPSRYNIAVNVVTSLSRIRIPTRSSTAPTRLVSSPSRYIIAVIRICNVASSLIRILTRSSTAPTRLVSSPSRCIIAVIRICNVLASLIRIRIPTRYSTAASSIHQAGILFP